MDQDKNTWISEMINAYLLNSLLFIYLLHLIACWIEINADDASKYKIHALWLNFIFFSDKRVNVENKCEFYPIPKD